MPDPHRPFLVPDVRISPQAIAVGETFTVTISIENQSSDAANDVSIELPLPAGVQPANGSGVSGGSNSSAGSFTWQEGTLGAYGSVTETVVLHMVQPQPGDAVLLQARISASNVEGGVTKTGGALVVSKGQGAATTRYSPGASATLQSADGRVKVQLPPNAFSGALTLQHDTKPKAGSGDKPTSSRVADMGSFRAFYLNAADEQGNEVHKFAAPLTIQVSYTPQQLEALDIVEEDLTLFWFDSKAKSDGEWVAIPTDVDTSTHTATAKVGHFSSFQLGDGSSPSEAYLPSVQGWQVGLYTGNVTYQYPIAVPAGSGGLKPNISLGYNSTSSDGKGGTRQKQQASWIGKDWSLDTGYVGLNRLASDQGASRYYTLVFNGQSFDIVRGNALGAGQDPARPDQWEWRSTDESFIRIRAEGMPALAGRGGTNRYGAVPRYRWRIWSKDGTEYVFEEDAWQGFKDYDNCANSFAETYKWYLTQVKDTHGNAITYSYWSNQRNNPVAYSAGCVAGEPNIYVYSDYSVWPDTIAWGRNVNVAGSTDRFKVQFNVSPLPTGMGQEYEGSANTIGGIQRAPHETKRLDSIEVWSYSPDNNADPVNSPYSWKMMSRYNLGYAGYSEANGVLSCPSCLLSDSSRNGGSSTYSKDTRYPKLTLTSIQQLDNAGTTGLPPATFTYGLKRHSTDSDNSTVDNYAAVFYPLGNWNRLTTVNNGQGGKVTFTYDNVGLKLAGDNQGNTLYEPYKNNRRVVQKVVQDGRGQSYTWLYDYTRPGTIVSYNSVGTVNGGDGPAANPNSATLYWGKYWDNEDQSSRLVRGPRSEFRGHSYVVETDPNLNQIEHWFHQGYIPTSSPCLNPTSRGATQIRADACFQELLVAEAKKGKEYRTITHAGDTSGPKLSEVNHTHTVVRIEDVNSGDPDPQTGLWRAFTYESETVQKWWEGTTIPVNKRATYAYDTSTGNLLSTTEYDAANTSNVYRKTVYAYVRTDPGNGSRYIIDRPFLEQVKDGANNLIADTLYGYDGALGNGNYWITGPGDLTLVRKFHDLPKPGQPAPATIHSTDTSYTYDTYGNRKTVTTYPGYGVVAWDGSWFGPPGDCASPCASALTTTTDYDIPYHALPVKITPPIPSSGVSLIERAGYDYRMGLMTSVTDPNGQITSAQYDTFGRMSKLIKPGDSASLPTIEASYWNYDASSGKPFEYRVYKRENLNDYWYILPSQQFYDGLGRLIQTRSESVDGGQQSMVVDKVYDGLGQLKKQSTPRYVPGFWGYQPVSTDPNVMLWTTSEYDALGRTTMVTTPDGKATSMLYKLNSNGRWLETVTYDANGHKKAHASDVFGRLMQVREYSGSVEPNYTLYSTTNYAYSPLDLLTSVTDTNNKVTPINYDSLGRKTSMTDPTMGTWSYDYNPDGTLMKQTDAKGQTVTFTYDALDRLTAKNFSDGSYASYSYDQGRTGYFNKGQRTTSARYNTSGLLESASYTDYDERGRQERVRYSIGGLSGGYRTFSYAYDSGDRVTSMAYPSGETVHYRYDAAWRQTHVCADPHTANCYARDAQYTALDQPQSFTLGNGLSQNYAYESLTKRLQSLQVGASGSVLSKSYTYDNVGNVKTLTDSDGTHSFLYDHLDRLTNWGWPGADESYSYDKLGNILTKGVVASPVSYTYNAASGNGGPYAIDSLSNGQAFTYDLNGNMTASTASSNGSIAARNYTWNVENLPRSITSGGVTENYTYDADGERISRAVTQNGQTNTTYYFGGLYEVERPSGEERAQYTLNGQVVAQRSIESCQGVNWVNTVNLTLSTSGTSITKTGSTSWNGGAVSDLAIQSGDGYAEYTVSSLSDYIMFGLSNGDSSQHYNDIDYAIYTYPSSGYLNTYEGGVGTGSAGTYAVGDVLRVAVEGGQVKYYRNGTLLRTSSKAPVYPLLADTALHDVGSTISSASLCGLDLSGTGVPQMVEWTNTANVTVSTNPGNTLTKSNVSGWNGGAVSNKAIAQGDGYAQYTVVTTTDRVMLGLSNADADRHYSEIDFALYTQGNGNAQVYEGGTLKASLGTIAVGDVLKVAVEGGVVKYYRNGTLLYTSTRTPVYPLLVDTSLYNVGDIISQAYISGQLASYVKWTNMHNVSSPPTGGALNRTESTTAWDAGAVSAPVHNQVIDKGGDGYAQYTVSSMSDYIMFGLSNGDSSQHYNDIDYAIYTYASTGYLYTYEGGVSTGSAGTYAVGDTLRVAVEGGVVKYYRNGTLLRTSGKAPVYPLLVDTSIRTAPPGGWIREPYIYKGIYGGARAEEVVYLHSDHLGSVSVATNGAGAVVSRQQYDPWGKVRSGGVTQTDLNYTGQRKDDTGLLYYHARYYDPSLARFVSADSIVPGVAPLLMDLGEVAARKDGTSGTEDPRSLNRYGYVLNNPLAYTDPSGHRTIRGGGRMAYRQMVHAMYKTLRNAVDNDRAFRTLQNDLADGLGTFEGLLLWKSKVEKNGDWDAGKGIRELYGAGQDDAIYFSAGGRKDVAYTLFGNILFGYLGAGVGYSSDSLANQGALFNLLTDPKGNNQADAEAIAFGIALWTKYGPNISEEDLAREIENYIRTHKVHTKRSVEACMAAVKSISDTPDFKGLQGCHGEAP